MLLVLAEHASGVVTDPSLQTIALARSFAAGEPVHALLVGPGGIDAAPALSSHGVAVAHIAEHEAFSSFAPDAWAAAIAGLAASLKATAVLAPGTDRGNEVMARVAARAGLPLACNCIAAAPGPPATVTRQRWGGSLLEEARLHSERPLMTVAPHTVAIEILPGAQAVEVRVFQPEIAGTDLAVRVVEHVTNPGGGISLAEAKVVVSGGRGVGSKEGFDIIEELAGLLGGAVGCSRVVTSAGWRPHTDQVGQTGTKISPDLYIACGISGATQHMAGCKGAKRILAINSDAEAPIMLNADYAVIGDLRQVVPAILAEVRNLKGSP
jgi:electron transfer flavoprotein alpha subunit